MLAEVSFLRRADKSFFNRGAKSLGVNTEIEFFYEITTDK